MSRCIIGLLTNEVATRPIIANIMKTEVIHLSNTNQCYMNDQPLLEHKDLGMLIDKNLVKLLATAVNKANCIC